MSVGGGLGALQRERRFLSYVGGAHLENIYCHGRNFVMKMKPNLPTLFEMTNQKLNKKKFFGRIEIILYENELIPPHCLILFIQV